MTTVRISDLPELRVDRLTIDDYIIVNDGDAVTSKISMEQFVFGIASYDITFTGNISFAGDVSFTGDVDSNFYQKNEVYNKNQVDILIAELEQYDRYQDERIFALVDLSGIPENTTTYPTFTYSIVPDDSTTFSALQSLEKAIHDDRDDAIILAQRVTATEQRGAKHENEINDLKINVDDINKKENAFRTLGYTSAYKTDAEASGNGIGLGDVYVSSPTGEMSDGFLKSRRV